MYFKDFADSSKPRAIFNIWPVVDICERGRHYATVAGTALLLCKWFFDPDYIRANLEDAAVPAPQPNPPQDLLVRYRYRAPMLMHEILHTLRPYACKPPVLYACDATLARSAMTVCHLVGDVGHCASSSSTAQHLSLKMSTIQDNGSMLYGHWRHTASTSQRWHTRLSKHPQADHGVRQSRTMGSTSWSITKSALDIPTSLPGSPHSPLGRMTTQCSKCGNTLHSSRRRTWKMEYGSGPIRECIEQTSILLYFPMPLGCCMLIYIGHSLQTPTLGIV